MVITKDVTPHTGQMRLTAVQAPMFIVLGWRIPYAKQAMWELCLETE